MKKRVRNNRRSHLHCVVGPEIPRPASPYTGEFFWSKLRGKGTFKEGRGPPEGRLLRRKHFRNLKEIFLIFFLEFLRKNKVKVYFPLY